MNEFKPYERVRIRIVRINDTMVENCQATYIRKAPNLPRFKGKSVVRIGGIDIMVPTEDVSKDLTTYET